MSELTSTAKKLDIFFRIAKIMLSVAMVTCCVGLVLIGAYFLFDLAPEMIGSGYDTVEIGSLELTLAEGIAPMEDRVLLYVAVEIALTLVILFITRLCVLCVRSILQPMKEGLPFHDTVCRSLKKMAKYTLVLGIAGNAIKLSSTLMLVREYDLLRLLLSDKVTHVTFNESFDLGFLVIAAALLLLSYVFRYGQELQQLSDETL